MSFIASRRRRRPHPADRLPVHGLDAAMLTLGLGVGSGISPAFDPLWLPATRSSRP